MHVSEFLKYKKKATEYDINYDSIKISVKKTIEVLPKFGLIFKSHLVS